MEKIIYASVSELALALRYGKVTSTEIVDAYLQRIEEINPNIIAEEKTPEELYVEMEMSEKLENALMDIGMDYQILIILKHFQRSSQHTTRGIYVFNGENMPAVSTPGALSEQSGVRENR